LYSGVLWSSGILQRECAELLVSPAFDDKNETQAARSRDGICERETGGKMGLVHARPGSIAAAPTAAPLLQVSNISFRYGGITALSDIPLNVMRGQIAGLHLAGGR
jgi:hypothetical protein